MPELPTGTVTFLFTDMEGSTRLLRQLRERYGDVRAEHERLLREAFEANGGHEIDTQGDSFFVAFRRARDAVAAAVAAQRALAEHRWPEGVQVRVRIGIHTGEPLAAEGRYVGLGIHRAARISAAGHGGQVLLSNATRELVEDDLPPAVRLRDLGEHRLKDIDRPEHVFQLEIDGLPSEFPSLKTLERQPPEPPFAGREGELAEAAQAVSPESALSEVHRKVGGAASQVVQLSVARGREDLAEALRAELASPHEPSTVVVVAGETKRGKSSLINALLGQPNLLPADADIATSAYLFVRNGPHETASVMHAGNPAGEEVSIDDLPDWVTPRGNPGNAKGVRGVVVSLDHPLLARGITLVDTPGTGGLDSAHAEVTKAALRTADVLLFVVDASAPLSRPELLFLEDATQRIETVLFALTKRDAYRGWEQILADDRALLARTRYAGARFFAVSSTLRLEASSLAADDELGRLMRTESGVDELESALEAHAVGKALVLRTANLLRLTQMVLERLDELEQAVIQAASGDGDDSAAELQAVKQRGAEFRARRTQGWRTFEREIRGIGQTLDLELNRALADLRSTYETRIAEGETEGVAQALETEVRAILLTLSTSLADRVEGVLDAVRSGLEVEGLAKVDVGQIDLGEGRGTEPPELRPRPGGGGVIDAFGSVTPAYMVTGLGLSLLGIWGIAIAGPIGLLLGGAIWTKRKSMQNQQQARALLMEAVDWARREVPPALRDEIAALKDAIETELLAAIERREKELNEAITECERVARETATARKQKRESAVGRRKEIVQMRAAVAALRAELERAARAVSSSEQPVPA